MENIFSMGTNIMSLAVWLGEDRKCSAAGIRFRFIVRVLK